MYPGNVGHFLESYADATSKPFGYLLVDSSPSLDDEQLRLRTLIFPDDKPGEIVYAPRVKA